TTQSRSNSRRGEPISAASLCCRSARLSRMPLPYLSKHKRQRRPGKAERLYRLLMKYDPTDAAPPFNLGNMLRANGRNVEAEAVFRAATRADLFFAEAWYNLSDLLDEQGRLEAAVDCLRKALRAAPAYTDAMSNLALLLQRSNKHAEAAEYWRRYLAKDGKSEWAARARRSLKFCEMQMHLSAS